MRELLTDDQAVDAVPSCAMRRRRIDDVAARWASDLERIPPYASVLDAARGLLGEVSLLLSEGTEPHIIVGGWSPLLLNSSPVPHPGTRDVDVLFSKGATAGALRDVVATFLERGYLPSAKHEFQLLRVLPVGDRSLVFNVDLLHPEESDPEFAATMFVDHVDLGVPLSDFLPEHYMMKSIVTPHAGFILEDGRSVALPVECVPPGAEELRVVDVTVVDEVGLIVTKSESVTSIKRLRDAFDIAVAIGQARDHEAMVQIVEALKDDRPEIYAVMGKLAPVFSEPSTIPRVAEFVASKSAAVAARLVATVLDFLEQVGLDVRPRAQGPD